MSMKRVLGMMLASRMAGRGRHRSLGTSAMLGGLGYRRRPRLGGKLGLAALGFMAYQAYRDQQARNPGADKAGSSGGLGGMVRDVAQGLGVNVPGATSPSGGASGATPELEEDVRAAEEFSNDTALLLIRAMITAAYSDGALSQEERSRILQEIDEAGGDAEDRRTMEREIANPKPLDELLAQVDDAETAQEFYLASRAALDPEAEHSRSYLSELRTRLKLSQDEVDEADEMAS